MEITNEMLKASARKIEQLLNVKVVDLQLDGPNAAEGTIQDEQTAYIVQIYWDVEEDAFQALLFDHATLDEIKDGYGSDIDSIADAVIAAFDNMRG